ncbi:MAG: PilN domain-containing protein [Patescibacteria group bacterium]
MGKSPLLINLLKKDQSSFVEKFIKWALSIGRVIIVITEAIALFTFLYRFNLDRELVDLHDSIKQKRVVINILKDNENTYRDLQARIALSAQLSDQGNKTVALVTKVSKNIPSGMQLNNINFLGNRIQIDANTKSVKTVSQFIETLKKYEQIQTVSLDKIENKTAGAVILVSITATLKQIK